MTGFTGSPLDRVDHVRSDPDAYAALLSDWRGRVLTLVAGDPVVDADSGLMWTSLTEIASDAELILLGLHEERPHFVVVEPGTVGMPMRSPAMFRAMSLLPSQDAAIFGTALSLVVWHNTHRFCARCGGTTVLFRAGWGRRCEQCGTEHFPRTDPVVIMLAEYGGRVLVGRQSRFPPGHYSALAGFLEPGESIEEAVRRELFEEAGIRTGAVRYVASQPWPFGGAQLMIACIAQAHGDALTLDPTELENAMWVSRADVASALEGTGEAPFRAPPPFAIAHSLFRRWLDEAS